MKDARPLKRHRGVNTETFADELLIYDVDRHRAHSLNATAARVWRECDGKSTAADIARRLAEQQVERMTEDVVLEAFDELDRAHLFEYSGGDRVADPSRRGALLKLGWAAAIPLVTSIAVPNPAFAQTSGPNFSTLSKRKSTGRGGSSGPNQ